MKKTKETLKNWLKRQTYLTYLNINRKIIAECIKKGIAFINGEGVYKDHKGGYFQIATGVGKSTIETGLISYELEKGRLSNNRKVIVIAAPKLLLNGQLCGDLTKGIKYFQSNEYVDRHCIRFCCSSMTYNIKKGENDNINIGKPKEIVNELLSDPNLNMVIITTYKQESIKNLFEELHKNNIEPDLVTLDESHKLTLKNKHDEKNNDDLKDSIQCEYLNTIRDYSKKTLAFSATQNDIVVGDDLNKNFVNIKTYNFKKAEEDGYVVPGVLIPISYDEPSNIISKTNRDEISNRIISGINTAMEYMNDNNFSKKILVTVQDIDTTNHIAKELAAKYKKDNITIYKCHSDSKRGGCGYYKQNELTPVSKDEILQIMNNDNGEYIIIYPTMLSEGINIPCLNAVMTFRNLSPVEFIQFWGRGARKIEGKEKFLFFSPNYTIANVEEDNGLISEERTVRDIILEYCFKYICEYDLDVFKHYTCSGSGDDNTPTITNFKQVEKRNSFIDYDAIVEFCEKKESISKTKRDMENKFNNIYTNCKKEINEVDVFKSTEIIEKYKVKLNKIVKKEKYDQIKILKQKYNGMIKKLDSLQKDIKDFQEEIEIKKLGKNESIYDLFKKK